MSYDRSVRPEPNEEYHDLDRSLQVGDTCVKMVMTFSGEEFSRRVQYPIIVECWEKNVGSKRRRYHTEFSETERKLIGTYHNKFYGWHLRTGTPQRVICSLRTLALLQRAVAFFASI